MPDADSAARACPEAAGSRESVRAIHDALPLLRLSRSVQVITIIRPSAESREDDAASLLAHLARHSVTVGQDLIWIKTAQEHASLREHIEKGPYDWLVMGAYSHPMWMEFIFGGVTQSILLSSKIPVLVSTSEVNEWMLMGGRDRST